MQNEHRMGGSYEDFGLMNLDKNYQLAVANLERDRFKTADFDSVYGKEEIARDEEKARGLEIKFIKRQTPEEERAKKFATIFESIFSKHAELSEWLGSSTFITPTSLYDDYENHVDMVAEFDEESVGNSHLALGIDVTFSNDMGDKFQRIKQEIENGEMALIKYFKSNDGDITGQLGNIPRAVIAVDPKTITELVELDSGSKNAELNKHWIQFQILEQLLVQIGFFRKHAEKCGQDTVVRKLKINQTILQKINMERREKVGDKLRRDNSNEKFIQQLEAVFN